MYVYSEYSCSISSKTWKVFTGNEMGALLGWWVLQQHEARGDKSEVYMLASVVSSKMLRTVVKGRGEFVETLTGFKWMGKGPTYGV
jgi:phosphoglucomutase / phosphopentomutase